MNVAIKACLVAVCLAVASAPGPAAAETRSMVAKPGMALVLGGGYVMTSTCNAGPLPNIAIVSPPAHGAATVALATITVPANRQCAGSQIKVRRVLYVPGKQYHGPDSVTFSTSWTASAQTLQQGNTMDTVSITVP